MQEGPSSSSYSGPSPVGACGFCGSRLVRGVFSRHKRGTTSGRCKSSMAGGHGRRGWDWDLLTLGEGGCNREAAKGRAREVSSMGRQTPTQTPKWRWGLLIYWGHIAQSGNSQLYVTSRGI